MDYLKGGGGCWDNDNGLCCEREGGVMIGGEVEGGTDSVLN